MRPFADCDMTFNSCLTTDINLLFALTLIILLWTFSYQKVSIVARWAHFPDTLCYMKWRLSFCSHYPLVSILKSCSVILRVAWTNQAQTLFGSLFLKASSLLRKAEQQDFLSKDGHFLHWIPRDIAQNDALVDVFGALVVKQFGYGQPHLSPQNKNKCNLRVLYAVSLEFVLQKHRSFPLQQGAEYTRRQSPLYKTSH